MDLLRCVSFSKGINSEGIQGNAWQRLWSFLRKNKKHSSPEIWRTASNLTPAPAPVLSEGMDAQIQLVTKISDVCTKLSQRVKVQGWIDKLRKQSRTLWFVTLRDGTGNLQAVLSGTLCDDRITLETSIRFMGVIVSLPLGKESLGGVEITVDKFEIIGTAPRGGTMAVLNKDSNSKVQLDNRHLLLRSGRVQKTLLVRSLVLQSLREHFFAIGSVEVTPPTFVQTQCEGGAALFKLNFFGEETFLTQSSQLYLETCLPAFRDVFCIAQSFRAEKSKTRRHLAEFTHVEVERSFITYEELLNDLETLIVDVTSRLFDKCRDLILSLNPEFQIPTRPIRRMTYEDGINWLKTNGVKKPNGEDYEFGEDIPEIHEQFITDTINEPILFCKFPAKLKAFYMSRCPDNTESVDVLLPNVGEIVGGSMRIDDYDELLDAYKREGIDTSAYYWYTDQRKLGSVPQGGYGLGLERFLCWMLKIQHVKDACLYPRYKGRCTP